MATIKIKQKMSLEVIKGNYSLQRHTSEPEFAVRFSDANDLSKHVSRNNVNLEEEKKGAKQKNYVNYLFVHICTSQH